MLLESVASQDNVLRTHLPSAHTKRCARHRCALNARHGRLSPTKGMVQSIPLDCQSTSSTCGWRERGLQCALTLSLCLRSSYPATQVRFPF